MARKRSLIACALNIVFIDTKRQNKPDEYKALFKALFDLKEQVNVYGDRWMAIGSSIPRGETTLLGVLDRFMEIDEERWYNRFQRRPATEKEMGRIVVPEDMAANLQDFFYMFDAVNHRLAFLALEGSRSLSASQTLKFFSILCSDSRIRERFGSVAVNIESEPSSVERILSSKHLRYLSVTLSRPNSIGMHDEPFDQKLTNWRASKERVELWADDEGSLNPPEELRQAARVAVSNGTVIGKVLEDNVVETLSTEQHPIRERRQYDPNTTNALEVFLVAGAALIEKIIESLK